MSFLYNEENYNSIINSAFPKKVAQQAAPAPVDPSLVQRLADRLNAELSPAAGDKFTPNVAGQAGVDLKYDDLKFDNLLKFLADNKLKFGPADKDRIVFTKDEFNNALPTDLAQQDKENYDALGNYYINPPALIDYIKYLQGKLSAQNNPLVNARLRLLADQVNQSLPGANLSRQPGKDSTIAPEFKDIDELDKVDNTFSPKYGVKDGANSLTVGDLKNKEALNAWLQGHQAQVVTYDAKGMAHEELYAKAKDIKAAWAAILKALYDRASRLRELATSAELAKKYDYYKKLLAGLGATGEVGAGQGTGPTQNANFSNQPGEAGTAAWEQIVDVLPLGNDINLFRINEFFDKVQSIYGSSQNQDFLRIINSYINSAKTSMTNLDSITNNMKIIKENTLPKDFAYFLKGSTAAYQPAINLLYSIINNTRQVIATIAGRVPEGLSDVKQKMNNQTDFYYGKNRGLLEDLTRQSSQIAR